MHAIVLWSNIFSPSKQSNLHALMIKSNIQSVMMDWDILLTKLGSYMQWINFNCVNTNWGWSWCCCFCGLLFLSSSSQRTLSPEKFESKKNLSPKNLSLKEIWLKKVLAPNKLKDKKKSTKIGSKRI